jgi:hypothetical protein
VPSDADSPAFKTSVGKVEYVPEKSCIIWKIKQFQGNSSPCNRPFVVIIICASLMGTGQKELIMHAHFGLPTITSGTSLLHLSHRIVLSIV